MRITVSTDSGLERFAALLSAVPGKAKRAFAEGLNEGGDKQRTTTRRALREQTGVKAYGSIVKRTKSRRASPGRLEYDIDGMGKGMPIDEVPVTAAKGRPVTARPWGVARTFKRSFVTSRQGLKRARIGVARMPIQALNGPSVAKETVKGQTAAEFMANAGPLARTMVIKRLGRIMP